MSGAPITDTLTPDARPGRPEPIRAIPVHHPGRWVAVAALAVLVAMFVHMLVTNSAFDWGFMARHALSPPVVRGALTSVELTILAMLIGIVFGVVLAVMRLSPNPILSCVSWLYTSVLRAVPRLVLAVLFGNVGILYARLDVGVPFDRQLGSLLGVDFNGRLFGVDAATLLSGFMAGLLALSLSEAAYMAEIVRAGIQSIDPGQSEAAAALGMRRGLVIRRIVLPQAMRVIVPPTGNETVAMLKDTSLVAYVPVSNELFFQLSHIGTHYFRPFPLLVAACLWYVAMASVLLVGQHFLERRFARGDATRTHNHGRAGRSADG